MSHESRVIDTHLHCIDDDGHVVQHGLQALVAGDGLARGARKVAELCAGGGGGGRGGTEGGGAVGTGKELIARRDTSAPPLREDALRTHGPS